MREVSLSPPKLHQAKDKDGRQVVSQQPITPRMIAITDHIRCKLASETLQDEPLLLKDTLQSNGFPPVQVVDAPRQFIVNMRNFGIGRLDNFVAQLHSTLSPFNIF